MKIRYIRDWIIRVAVGGMAACLPLNASAGSADITGITENETAYRLSGPTEFTKVRNTVKLIGSFKPSPAFQARAAVRSWYDAVFDLERNYPENVRRDLEYELSIREAVADISLNDNMDLRAGLQQIVWGEAPGVFITDVVNPRDYREFVLPKAEDMRIPLWAVDCTYTASAFAVEGVWIPFYKQNRLAQAGSEFEMYHAPPPPGAVIVYEPAKMPSRTIENSEAGVRISSLADGWDVSLFYFYAFNRFSVYFRRTGFDSELNRPVTVISPRITRVQITGATVTKSWDRIVLKGEAAYTMHTFLEARDRTDSDGVVTGRVLDYLAGLDYAFDSFDVYSGLTGNVQSAPRAGVRDDRASTYAFLDAKSSATVLGEKFRFDALVMAGVSGSADYRISPTVTWEAARNTEFEAGADVFSGKPYGLFGQFDHHDRVRAAVRYAF